jgi:hypothetical protein
MKQRPNIAADDDGENDQGNDGQGAEEGA